MWIASGFSYSEPDFLYVRSSLPSIFFSGGVTMGNIGRQLALVSKLRNSVNTARRLFHKTLFFVAVGLLWQQGAPRLSFAGRAWLTGQPTMDSLTSKQAFLRWARPERVAVVVVFCDRVPRLTVANFSTLHLWYSAHGKHNQSLCLPALRGHCTL